MRLFRLSTAYPDYLERFYRRQPELARRPWAEQRQTLDRDAFGWGDAWSRSLAPLGYQVMEAYLNAEVLQRAWAREFAPDRRDAGLPSIAAAQIRAFAPDVLWFDHHDARLLAGIRAEAPSIRRVLGWAGSAIPEGDAWAAMDVVLSCAPESVEWFRARGLRAEQLHHAFDTEVSGRLAARPPALDVSFVGQFSREHRFHLGRERLLDAVLGQCPVAVFGPAPERGMGPAARGLARRALGLVSALLRGLGVPEAAIGAVPLLRRAAAWRARPRGSLSPRVRRALEPPRFGLELFQTLQDSRITLNIHADSSPRCASNMRLFEATGVGACLLTDWKENLPELFEPDREVATYRDASECLEKIRWLLAHDAERQAIARAGQARTLAQHTFPHRARRLDAIIRAAIA
jgi:spore maturation protein CgeB